MDINADFTKLAHAHYDDLPWQPSPMPGVSRRMLDRIGDEVARATTIVKYEANSEFAPHVHTGGEEFIVLEGVFQDEHGDYPKGTYIRNPPTSSHQPRSKTGCVIFVKLWQFDLDDRTHIIIDLNKIGQVNDPTRHGISLTPLYKDDREEVFLENWPAGAVITIPANKGGCELLVLKGGFYVENEQYKVNSWIRLPSDESMTVKCGDKDTQVWMKTGHLKHIQIPNG